MAGEFPMARMAVRSTRAKLDAVKAVAAFIGVIMATGCASTNVSNRQQLATAPLARPSQIWVYEFAASPADVSPESAIAGQTAPDAPVQTAEQVAEGRKLGALIATELVREIKDMGMPAEIATAATRPQPNDIVIEGTLLSIQEGSGVKRVIVGFSAGGSEMKVAVEGFQMTASGLRKLGSGNVDSTGNKTPGSAVGLAVLIATHNPAGFIVSTGMKVYGEKSGSNTLQGRAKQTAREIGEVLKKRFQQEGWIES
jgi:hypothetical protein